MTLPARFARIAAGVAAKVGGPFHTARIIDPGEAVYDDGGSIVTPAEPVYRPCRAQIDAATEAMRQSDGFADGDVRFLVLSASLDGGLDTDARVEVLDGPHAGVWLVSSITLDPAAIGWEGKGRRE